MDFRIRDYHINPAFEYDRYCLSKDTKQINANYGNVSEIFLQ